MSEALEQAKRAERKAERRYTAFRNMFFVYLVVVTLFTSFQTIVIQQSIKDSLEISRRTAATNHQRTQDYVKCIAQVLLKPLAQRSDTDFSECTVKETANSDLKDKATAGSGDTQNSVAGQQPPVIQQLQIIVRDKEPPTTVAPPDPEVTTPPTPGNQTPANDSRVLTIIDGILREVDDSPLNSGLSKLGL